MNSTQDILISVHERHVRKMISGEKSIEWRRRPVNVTRGTRIWIYTTRPRAAVQALATVEEVVNGSPASLWKKYRERAGVAFDEFAEYFRDSEVCCAVLLKDCRALKTEVKLDALKREVASFHPPQFYMTLRKQNPMLRFLNGRREFREQQR